MGQKNLKTGYCIAEFCVRKHHGNGFCKMHNWSFIKNGDPLITKIRLPIPDYLKKQLRTEAKRKYKKTEKGIQSEKRYMSGDKYKQALKRVNKKRAKDKIIWSKTTEKGIALRKKYVKQRRDMIKMATPKWANKKDINNIYLNCPKGYHVDHIIPLKNDIVCGLHVPWNLQYLPAGNNYTKGNKI